MTTKLIILVLFVIAVAHSPELALVGALYTAIGACLGVITFVIAVMWWRGWP